MTYQLTYPLTISPRTTTNVTITATAQPTFAQNLVHVGNLGVYDSLTLVRVINSVESDVRGATGVAVSSVTVWDVFDYECPLDTDVFYRAYLDGGTTPFVSNTVNIATDGRTFWLKDVILGSFSTTVNVESMSDVVRSANVLGTFKVLGRQNPVIVTDVRQGRTGTMVLTGFDEAGNIAIKNIIASGNTLLFQAPGNSQFDDMYFQAGDVNETWRGVSSEPIHSFSVPFTETDPPSEAAFSLANNAWLLVAQFDNWQDVLNSRADWEAVFIVPFGPSDV